MVCKQPACGIVITLQNSKFKIQGSKLTQEWTGRTDGGTLLQRWLIAILRCVDVRVIYFIMAFVVPFYMVFNRKGYKAIRDFFKKSRGYRGLRLIWHIYLNHFVFGQVVIDRFAIYAGRKFNLIEDEKTVVDEQMQKPEGMVISKPIFFLICVVISTLFEGRSTVMIRSRSTLSNITL